MTTVKMLCKNVDKKVENLNFKGLSTGEVKLVGNKKPSMVAFDNRFIALSCTTVAGIIATATKASKLKLTELVYDLNRKTFKDEWAERFTYKNGEWTYTEKLQGMRDYELKTILKEIAYTK